LRRCVKRSIATGRLTFRHRFVIIISGRHKLLPLPKFQGPIVSSSVSKGLALSVALALGFAGVARPALGVEYKKKTPAPREQLQLPATSPVRPVSHSLTAFLAAKGALRLSVDGTGTDLSFGTVEVSKPAGGTVRSAYLMAALTGGYLRPFEDGDIQVSGHRVMWERVMRNGVGSWNALADVTRFVESEINAAPPGRVLIDISEDHSDLVDGTILAVVFDDPSASPDNFIALYFGSHAQRTDSLVIELPSPVPSSVSDARAELGVGISYSLQSSAVSDQSTIIDVNGQRLTTSAGGPDDGSPSPGALITVGGSDDSPANPSDASALPADLASDDELYDLRPFLTPGESKIVVKTSSRSEENLFFASFFWSPVSSPETASLASAIPETPARAVPTSGTPAVVLSTASSRSSIGASCETSAAITRGGLPLTNAAVELKVLAGPHAGAVTRARTKDSGVATFLYRGKQSGRDLLVAIVMEGDTAVAGSNVVTHDWVEEILDTSIDISPGTCPNTIETSVQGVVTVALTGSETFEVDDVDITSLYLGNAAPLKIQYRDVTSPPGPGQCACSDAGGDGFRDIVMQFKLEDVLADIASVTDGASLKWTLAGSTKSGKLFRVTDCVVIAKTPGPPIQPPNEVLAPLDSVPPPISPGG